MRCNPGRWLWGLIPVAMLTWLAVMGEHAAIERDLGERAGKQLKEAGIEWAGTGFEGRDGMLSGKAVSEEQRRRAAEVVANLWGVRVVEDRAHLAQVHKPLVWSAVRQDAGVRLSGDVPTEAARIQLVELARSRFPGAKVEDRMMVATGDVDSARWMHGAEFAVGQLGRLSSGGSVGLEGELLSVSGRAETSRDYNLVRGALAQTLPDGFRLKNDRVLPPAVNPYVWDARFDGTQLEFAGHVPNDNLRDEILTHAKRALPSATIIDRMATATGEPTDWPLAVMRALTHLAALQQGTLGLNGTVLTVRGTAEREEQAREITDALRREVPKSFTIIDQIAFKRPTIPTVKPFVTTVEIGEEASHVSGHVPGEEARAALLALVKEAGKVAAVDDVARLGAGADKGWLACLRAGIAGLQKIGGGKLVLTDRALEMSGQSSTEELIEETTAAVRAGVNRACDLHARIGLIALPEPELLWTATRGESGVELAGEVPDETTRTKLVARAKELFPSARLTDTMTVKPAVSAKWPVVALAGLDMLAKLRAGKAELDEQHLTVSGQAPDTVVAAAIRDALKRDLPHGYTGNNGIEVRSDAMLWAEQEAKRKAIEEARRKAEAEQEALRRKNEEAQRVAKEKAAATERARSDAERAATELQGDVRQRVAQGEVVKRKQEIDCRDAMRDTVSKGRIRFARASSTLHKDSYATLDRLADVVRGCPGASINIEGHTDSDGSTVLNKRLSKRRAVAVVQYLVKVGIDPNRLRAVGYGEGRPLLPNTSAANKSQNRRIDFTVRMK